jgi:hypothetical protein
VDNGIWLLRYRNRSGKLCKVRLATREVCRRLQAGLLPAAAEARRLEHKGFRPLLTFDEFKDVRPAPHPRRRRLPRPRPAPPAPAVALPWVKPLLAVASAVLLTILVAFCLFKMTR